MKIIPRPCVAKLTTIGIEAECEALVEVEDIKDVEETANFIDKKKVEPFFLGMGSNIIPEKKYISRFLVKLKKQNRFDIILDKKEVVLVNAWGGASLRGLIMWCVKNGYAGIESLIGIPGSIGGAIYMNAGSFGAEIKDVVHEVTFWHKEKGIVRYKREELEFSYRRFSPPFSDGPWCVVSALFCFKRKNRELLRSKIKQIFLKKKNSQPVTSKTCGCVFKNTKDHAAGYLLDMAGMKGKRIGDMMFSDMHANFLINKGKGTPSQAKDIITMARETVKEKFGVNLELEVKLLS